MVLDKHFWSSTSISVVMETRLMVQKSHTIWDGAEQTFLIRYDFLYFWSNFGSGQDLQPGHDPDLWLFRSDTIHRWEYIDWHVHNTVLKRDWGEQRSLVSTEADLSQVRWRRSGPYLRIWCITKLPFHTDNWRSTVGLLIPISVGDGKSNRFVVVEEWTDVAVVLSMEVS